eukprot:283847_1
MSHYYHDELTNLIVFGYIREAHYVLASSPFYQISSDIIQITLSYVGRHFILHCGSYQWQINDKLLKEMLAATNGQKFSPDHFKIAGLNWQIHAYPNGHKTSNIGNFGLFLKLLSLPSNWKEIILYRRIQCKETQSSFTSVHTYKQRMSNGWTNGTLLLQNIINRNLTQLTIDIHIQILRIIFIKNDQLYFQHKIGSFNSLKTQSFIWSLNTKLLNEMKQANFRKIFESPIFNNMFCLGIYPKGHKKEGECEMYIQLCSLPNNMKNVSVNWKLLIKETNTKMERNDDFNYDHSRKNWGSNLLSFKTLKKCDSFTVCVDIKLDDSDESTTRMWSEYVYMQQNIQKQKQIEMSDMHVIMRKIDEINMKIN